MPVNDLQLTEVPAVAAGVAVPLWRLYTLRACYLILAVGLGFAVWPDVVVHTAPFAIAHGVQFSLLAGMGATALLGLRYPVRMVPLLLFELTWKLIYLVAFALPLWRAGQMTPAVEADVAAVLVVVLFVPLIPWIHVWRRYAVARGERWR